MTIRLILTAALILVLLVVGCEATPPAPTPVSPASEAPATSIPPTVTHSVLRTPVSPAPTVPPTATPRPTVQALIPEMVLVEAGDFQMGATDGRADEQPVHMIQITRAFYVSQYEVTFAEYDQFCADTVGVSKLSDHGQGRGNRPVTGVKWFDAVAYCNWLSEKEGLTPCYSGKGRLIQCDFAVTGYRLPTEAEWEYAARGGHLGQDYLYAGGNNPDDVAWYGGNAEGHAHPVGQKQPNELGLYDMSGNSWEWCWDLYSAQYYASSPANDPTGPAHVPAGQALGPERVRRGGNCLEDLNLLRVTCRSSGGATYPGNNGFRLVRTKEATPTLTGGGVIAFVSDRHGNDEIYVMNADGSDPRRLTRNGLRDGYPAWSPDRQKIAFCSYHRAQVMTWSIHVMDADGSNEQRLTNTRGVMDYAPAWSPDGKQIAFGRNSLEIWVMNADGSNQRRIGSVSGGAPDWSPAPPGGGTSGTQIAFHSEGAGDSEICVVNADGSNPRQLTDNDAQDRWPAWSPAPPGGGTSGTQIAFMSDRDGNWEIYVMNADGSNPRRLTYNDAEDWEPNWSPDGSRLVFFSARDGNCEIYVMDADGTNLQRLTNNSVRDIEATWRP